MRIERIETIRLGVTRRGGWLFVELHTDTGVCGLGEASQSGDDDQVVALIREEFAAQLLTKDPRRVAELTGTLTGPAAGTSVEAALPRATAISALEQALWDLTAKAHGVPLHVLLGGAVRCEPVPLYANINRGVWNRAPDGFAAQALAAVADGFTSIKCAPFDEVSPKTLQEPGGWAAVEHGIARVVAVREAIGPDIDLMVDCHGRFTPDAAIRTARALEPLRLTWLEEPVAWDKDADGLRRVRAATDLPIAAAERAYGVQTYWDLIRNPVADVLMPDVKHCGGVWQARAIATLAQAGGLAISPHNPSGPVATLVSAHLAATLPNLRMLEFPFGEVDWRADVSAGSERLVGGYLCLPTAPGTGAALDPEILASRGAVRSIVGA